MTSITVLFVCPFCDQLCAACKADGNVYHPLPICEEFAHSHDSLVYLNKVNEYDASIEFKYASGLPS